MHALWRKHDQHSICGRDFVGHPRQFGLDGMVFFERKNAGPHVAGGSAGGHGIGLADLVQSACADAGRRSADCPGDHALRQFTGVWRGAVRIGFCSDRQTLVGHHQPQAHRRHHQPQRLCLVDAAGPVCRLAI